MKTFVIHFYLPNKSKKSITIKAVSKNKARSKAIREIAFLCECNYADIHLDSIEEIKR